MEMEKIIELAKRRGFFITSSEIYGGFAGFYDYGSTGTLLKRKIEKMWKHYFLGLSNNFFEIETSYIMPEKVFEASGHLVNFVDPVAKCKKCGKYHRADHIMEEYLKENFEGMSAKELTESIKKHKIKCPKCKGELAEVKVLNLMFPLTIGAASGTQAYLRPETAQGAYVNFLRHFNIHRNKLPLGLAIVGRAFRNEISPRQGLIRQREFTQAELQIFFDPKTVDEHERWDEVKNYKLLLYPYQEKDRKIVEISCEQAVSKFKLPKFYVYHLAKVQQFFLDNFNIPREKFRFRELSAEERAFYNKIHFDAEVFLPGLGEFKEIAGVHYRTDHDLSGHQKVSKQSHEIFFNGKRFVPHVLELTAGIDRIFYMLLELSYKDDKERGWEWFDFPANLAPYAVAVFPLVSKDKMPEKAQEIYKNLWNYFYVFYDESGSIGKRYARADEIGTPFAITVDHQSLEDDTVTVRERNTTKQERVKIQDLVQVIQKKLKPI